MVIDALRPLVEQGWQIDLTYFFIHDPAPRRVTLGARVDIFDQPLERTSTADGAPICLPRWTPTFGRSGAAVRHRRGVIERARDSLARRAVPGCAAIWTSC